MSIKIKSLAAAGLLTIAVGGISAVGAFSASAATPAPEHRGLQRQVRHGHQPQLHRDRVPRCGEGRPADRSEPRQRLIPGTAHHRPPRGLVSDFYKAGLVSAKVNQHYGSLNAAQLEYAPNGVPSHLCVGLKATAYQNESLTLQSCDTPRTTVWIIDTADKTAEGYFPILNGSTTDFAHPYAMTYYGDPSHEDAADKPIRIAHLLNNPAHIDDNQLWGVLKK
ncbi:hypothetical protein ACFQ0G_48700 [Streptomyces chiangmaiensis]